MKECKIYCLKDPRNKKPFYVGSTEKSLNIRLAGHAVKTNRNSAGSISHKRFLLIQEIISEGYNIIIEVLDTVPFDRVDEVESGYYNTLKNEGNEMLQSEKHFTYQQSSLKTSTKFLDGNIPFLVRLNPETYALLKDLAARKGTSMNDEINEAINDHISKNKKYLK